MDLSGFKEYSLSNGLPTITIAKSGISFSRTAVIRLGKPAFAELRIDSEKKQIVIIPSDENNANAAPFFRENRNIIAARWNYKDLIQTFENLMNWDTDTHTYKVEGSYSMENNLLFFDLNNFQTIK